MITLGELIAGLDENKTCVVLDTETLEEVAKYDGRDSIPADFNEYAVTDWFGFNDKYLVLIRR